MTNTNFERRKRRVRYQLKIRSNKPRLCVHVTNSHMYVQLIDGMNTLASSSSLEMKMKNVSSELAGKIGADIAEKAKKKKVVDVVFDRGGYLYHGKVKALAEGARSAGLKF